MRHDQDDRIGGIEERLDELQDAVRKVDASLRRIDDDLQRLVKLWTMVVHGMTDMLMAGRDGGLDS